MEQANEKIQFAVKYGSTLLDFSNLGIETCPSIPDTIDFLILNDNNLTELPNLPPSLKDLYVDNNKLTQITLPPNLITLSCVNNQIKEINNIPESLQLLDCRYNLIESDPVVTKGAKVFLRPKLEIEILEIPAGSKNALTDEEIVEGNIIVDFDTQKNQPSYHLKSSYDKLKAVNNQKINPYTRRPIKNKKLYTAKIKRSKNVLVVEQGSENAISLENITEGAHLVNFENESKHQRYYLNSTFKDLMKKDKLNPFTKNPIKNAKNYTAKIKSPN